MRGGARTKKVTICWECENACGGCEWSEIDPETRKPRFAPVPGWTAEACVLRMGGQRQVTSYHVEACPKFTKGKRTRKKSFSPAEKEAFLDNMEFFFRRLNGVGRSKVD